MSARKTRIANRAVNVKSFSKRGREEEEEEEEEGEREVGESRDIKR